MRGFLIHTPLKSGLFNHPLFKMKWSDYSEKVACIHEILESRIHQDVGWLNAPLEKNEHLLHSIQTIANEIKKNADVLVVIGVGGSYLGAKAIQETLTPYFQCHENGIEVIYVGQNLSGSYVKQLLDYLKEKEIYVNVISKSGTTMETALAFRVFREYMEVRYSEAAHQRIIVTTDKEKGLLKEMANELNYRGFVIPSNIGGRFSVLTAVGLLPIAVAGVDIHQLIKGAKEAAHVFNEIDIEKNEAYQYAVIRHELYKKGYEIELIASFDPSLASFHGWLQQLFAESEGKNRKGLFPTSAIYTTDLHSIGQFIQEGTPILFETIVHFKQFNVDCLVPTDNHDRDGLNYLVNKSFNDINDISKDGVIAAHAEAGVPIFEIELERLDAYHIGYLIYFFMKACAISASLLEVNPFDQPGVEAYKSKIRELLQRETIYN